MMDSYPQDKKRKAALKGGERDASGPLIGEKKKTENGKPFDAPSLNVRFCFG
jgi:hypothetical protein